jgi:hypothetical protein
MQPSLFIITPDPISENYRKNFKNLWSFHRLIKEDRAALVSLAENIRTADTSCAIDPYDCERVLYRIELCLALSQDDFLLASKNKDLSEKVFQKLKNAEMLKYQE